jgi:predicted nucleotidyltransferase
MSNNRNYISMAVYTIELWCKMELKHKILTLLVEHKFSEFTIREIALKLGVDYKNTYVAVQKLANSISIEKKGSSSFVSFKPVFKTDAFLVETERKKSVEKKLRLLVKDISSIDNPFFIPILFGSYAKGKGRKNSDIDLCIIHTDDAALRHIVRKLSIHTKLEVHGFTPNEFISMIQTKGLTVGTEVVKFGIPLKNIESYYEVMGHGF